MIQSIVKFAGNDGFIAYIVSKPNQRYLPGGGVVHWYGGGRI